jgi:hypothetical protein
LVLNAASAVLRYMTLHTVVLSVFIPTYKKWGCRSLSWISMMVYTPSINIVLTMPI